MRRLIDADALITAVFKKAMDDAFLNGNTDMHKLLISVVAHQPTVDAIPIEWILNNERMPKEGKGHDAIMDMITDWRREHDTDD